MKSPTFDSEGYPTNETLDAIESWNVRDPKGWLHFCSQSWNGHYGTSDMYHADGSLIFSFATGGWSGNEEVLGAMQRSILWAMLWMSSHRGGLTYFKLTSNDA